MARKLEIEIVGDASSFSRALGKASSSSSGFGGALKSLGKVAAGVGVAIGAGLAVAAKVGFKEFAQGQKVAAQTGAVLKSTGGAANVTAKQVDKLATSLMKKSGVDDEAIASGENMLLTFTKIRNEVGKGNDIFNQATTATLDLSVAMGKDMQSSAILVGKALNDPIKGMTALSKAGVQFTDAQKKSIKTMVEHGDVVGAQKLILKELEIQFGGSAEAAGKTFVGMLNILTETLSNVAGEIVGRFMPAFVAIANVAGPLVVQALDLASKALTKLGDFITTHVIPKLQQMVAYVRDTILPQITTWAAKLRDDLTPAYRTMSSVALAVIGNVAKATEENKGKLTQTWNNVKSILGDLAAIFTSLPAKIAAIINPLSANIAVWALFGDKIGGYVIGRVEAITGKIATLVGWIRTAVEAVNSLISALGRIRVPSINLPNVDPRDALNRLRRRAAGGPVGAGMPYMVGERGPEMFVPGRGGTIVPNHALGGGGVVHEHHYHGPVVQDKVFLDYLKNLAAKDTRRNGRSAFG